MCVFWGEKVKKPGFWAPTADIRPLGGFFWSRMVGNTFLGYLETFWGVIHAWFIHSVTTYDPSLTPVG